MGLVTTRTFIDQASDEITFEAEAKRLLIRSKSLGEDILSLSLEDALDLGKVLTHYGETGELKLDF